MIAFCLVLLLTLAHPGIAAEEGTFRFLELGWAHEISGYGDYLANYDGVVHRGERAYAYFEVADFAVRDTEDGFLTDIKVDVMLRSSSGLPLFKQSNLVEYTEYATAYVDTLWFYIWIDIPSWAPRGTYQAEVIVRDEVSGDRIHARQPIRVE